MADFEEGRFSNAEEVLVGMRKIMNREQGYEKYLQS